MMVISHKFKLVYIHISKTAGSFITNVLKELDTDAVEILDCKDTPLSGHLRLHHVQQLDIYEDIKSYCFFASIRNPIRRCVSAYNYVRGLEGHFLYPKIKNKSFYEAARAFNYHTSGKMVDYLKDISGKINKDIKLLICTDALSADLIEFLGDVGVPKKSLRRLKKKSIFRNASNKFFDEDIDVSKLDFSDFSTEDLLFYLSKVN